MSGGHGKEVRFQLGSLEQCLEEGQCLGVARGTF